MVHTKKDPQISALASLALSLANLNVSNDLVNHEIHGTTTAKRKTNRGQLLKKKLLKEYEDVFDTLPGRLHVEVDKSIRSVQNVPRKIPVAIKKEIMKKIDELTEQNIVAKANKPTDWVSSMVVNKKPQSNKLRICVDHCHLKQALHRP